MSLAIMWTILKRSTGLVIESGDRRGWILGIWPRKYADVLSGQTVSESEKMYLTA
jgi:hypothetical protein